MIPKEIYVGFLHAINALLNLLRIQAKNFEILINVILWKYYIFSQKSHKI